MKRAICLLGATTTMLIAPLTVPAQAVGVDMRDEIVVTSRKREESIQDVPISIKALTEQQLERQSIRGAEDIARVTPGLNYEGYISAGQAAAPVIRGQAQTQLTNRVQNVSTFLDGVYLQNQGMVDLGILDFARVEVVKGPQSALYGRNSFAGAIEYITREASDIWTFGANTTAGSDGRLDLVGNISGPIWPDVLKFKGTFGTSEFDGTRENNHPNAGLDLSPGTEGEGGGYDNEAFSVGLAFTPTDEMEFKLNYYNAEVDRELAPSYVFNGINSVAFGLTAFNDLNCNTRVTFGGFGPAGNSLWCGELPVNRPQVAGDPRPPGIVIDPRGFGLQAETEVITFNASYDFGGASLNFIYGNTDYDGFAGGINDRDPTTGQDVSGLFMLPFPFFQNVVDSRPNALLESDSYELRLQSSGDGPWTWLAGFYFSNVEDSSRAGVLTLDVLGTDSIAADIENANTLRTEFEDDVWAVFGSLEYAFNDIWSVVLDARYSQEDKSIVRVTDAIGLPFMGQTTQKEDYDYFTPRLVVNWQFADDAKAYVSAAKGIKTGGFNLAVNPAQGQFDEEENWTFELGAKTAWMDGRLVANGALFFIDSKDLQISESQFGPGVTPLDPTVIGNAGGAETLGLELDLIYQLTDGLVGTFGLAYHDPEYDDGVINQDAQRNISCDGIICPADHGIGGNSLERQSKVQFNAQLDYEQQIAGDLTLFGTVDVSHKSKQYLTSLNVGDTGSRTLVGARLGLEGEIGGFEWTGSVWGKNIFDKDYVANSFVINFANSYVVSLGEEATYGLDLKVRFNLD